MKRLQWLEGENYKLKLEWRGLKEQMTVDVNKWRKEEEKVRAVVPFITERVNEVVKILDKKEK